MASELMGVLQCSAACDERNCAMCLVVMRRRPGLRGRPRGRLEPGILTADVCVRVCVHTMSQWQTATSVQNKTLEFSNGHVLCFEIR